MLKRNLSPKPPSSEADSKVGYGKPPEHSRFKPGQSGNPKGRPKRAQNVKGIVSELMNEQVMLRVGGKSRKMTPLEVMLRNLRNNAMAGKDLKAVVTVLDLLEKPGLLRPDAPKALGTRINVRFINPKTKEAMAPEDFSKAAGLSKPKR